MRAHLIGGMQYDLSVAQKGTAVWDRLRRLIALTIALNADNCERSVRVRLLVEKMTHKS